MKYTIPVKSLYQGVTDFEITAYNTDAPGLIAHHFLEGSPGNPKIGNTWEVTHMKSGRVINPDVFKLLKDAKEYAKRIAHLVDWEQDKDVLEDIEGLRDALEFIYLDVVSQ